MSYSTSTLLTRNLQDVFGENDPARRRAAIEEIFTEDCVFYDPSRGVYSGRDEIDRVAGATRATHPDFRYQPIAKPEELGNGGRVPWGSGRPGEAPAYARTDFIIVPDGRGAALNLFFDKDRKSTRLNSSHRYISYAVFCFKKKKLGSDHACQTFLAGSYLPLILCHSGVCRALLVEDSRSRIVALS